MRTFADDRGGRVYETSERTARRGYGGDRRSLAGGRDRDLTVFPPVPRACRLRGQEEEEKEEERRRAVDHAQLRGSPTQRAALDEVSDNRSRTTGWEGECDRPVDRHSRRRER